MITVPLCRLLLHEIGFRTCRDSKPLLSSGVAEYGNFSFETLEDKWDVSNTREKIDDPASFQ
jgi:hypothetical protein